MFFFSKRKLLQFIKSINLLQRKTTSKTEAIGTPITGRYQNKLHQSNRIMQSEGVIKLQVRSTVHPQQKRWYNNPLHSKTFIEVIGLSIPLSLWKTESLPTASFRALLERASASLFWDLGMWWKMTSAKELDNFLVLVFQLSKWTELSLDFWDIQSMMMRESPRTCRCLMDHLEAR